MRIEQLLHRPVRDASGRIVGRIEEIRCTTHGDGLRVVEYRLGAAALLRRLAGTALIRALVPWVRTPTRPTRVVPAGSMDLADPIHPRLRPK